MSEIGDFIGELGAGTFEEKVHAALREAGYSAMKTNASSEITIKLKITPASQSQAKVEHTISTDMPTLNGKKKEINKTHTLMYVGEKGKLSIFPENQADMFSNRSKKAAQTEE